MIRTVALQYCTVQYDDTVQYSTVQYCTVWYSTVPGTLTYCTVQNKVQYSTVLYCGTRVLYCTTVYTVPHWHCTGYSSMRYTRALQCYILYSTLTRGRGYSDKDLDCGFLLYVQ